MLARWRNDRQGATSIEYGMIVAMIALAIVAGVSLLGDRTKELWGRVETAFAAYL